MPRAVDILIAALALLLLSPLLLIAAVAIKLGSRGPVFYRQRRVGRDGEEFEMLKLRTMVEGSDPVGVGTVVTRDDPRVTAPAGSCAAPRSTRSPTWSTSCAARWRSSARDRRSRPRWSTTRRASNAGTRSALGSPAGPRSRAAPASPGRNGSSSTSSTSTIAALPSTPASSPRPSGCSSPATASPRTDPGVTLASPGDRKRYPGEGGRHKGPTAQVSLRRSSPATLPRCIAGSTTQRRRLR